MSERPGPRVHVQTARLFYEASASARAESDQLLTDYRATTAKVLAVATGALALFGFEDSDKGGFFYAAVVAYLVAAVICIVMYRPIRWNMNVAHDMVEPRSGPVRASDRINGLLPSAAYYQLGRGHQIAILQNRAALERRFGVVRMFQAVLALTVLTVLFGVLNVAVHDSDSAEDQPPTTVQIDEENP